MDILTHTLSGFAVGTVVSGFSKLTIKEKLKIFFIAGLGGAFPDIDGISLWSKFDDTFGKFFNLSHTGRQIYYGKFWYSHHAFFHSLLASLLIGCFIFLLFFIFESKFKNFKSSINRNKLLLIGFIIGYNIHLFEDMPTPASVWGGINYFWPLKTYIGGTGNIWWWNNYDIFLIVASVLVINLILHIIGRFVNFNLQKFTIVVFIAGFILIFHQIKHRGYSFYYTGHTRKYQIFEQKSKEIQRKILGNKLFYLMEQFDKKLPIYF